MSLNPVAPNIDLQILYTFPFLQKKSPENLLKTFNDDFVNSLTDLLCYLYIDIL